MKRIKESKVLTKFSGLTEFTLLSLHSLHPLPLSSLHSLPHFVVILACGPSQKARSDGKSVIDVPLLNLRRGRPAKPTSFISFEATWQLMLRSTKIFGAEKTFIQDGKG
ncbi:hypothetical protein AMTR_s04508p00002990 [Amborella trichopoda]|uniref:Uncharacterized protein n=1 Tax=Amborella trichopoda TaxID=13333 RepID=U5D0U5_AMBTC|nr:hypothetical protein AMTR_s04508p00002990 [Amborella trichopoda]